MNNNNATPQTEDEIRAELEDRLMDLNLEELLGSPRISGAAHVAAPTEPVTCAPATNGVSRHRRRLFQVLGVICPLLILGTVWYFTPPDRSEFTTVGSKSLNGVSSEAPASQSLPSPNYGRDDLQYYPSEPGKQLSQLKSSLETWDSYQENMSWGKSAQAGQTSGNGEQAATSSPVYPVGDLVRSPRSNRLEEITRGQSQYKEDNNLYYENRSGVQPSADKFKAKYGDGTAPAETAPSNSPAIRFPNREEWERITEDRKANPDPRADFDFSIQDPASREAANRSKPADFGTPRLLLAEELPRHDPSEGRGPDNSGDNYAPIVENPFQVVTDAPLSTFSIDVDTASYSNIRRILSQNNMLPPPDAVRIEEMVNYFNYTYPAPVGDDPFSVNVDQVECPWQPKHRLVRIGLKGKEIPVDERPASNLVFLLDVSGSMSSDNKLPLLKSCLKMMVDYLSENDRVAIVVYAGSSGLVLPSTTGDSKAVIMEALDRLNSGGSTNGGAGIELAYKTAVENFIEGGSNRVILATDGDFNVGTTGEGDLQRLIEEKAKSGVFLTTLGFGYGNLQDNTIELLANKGNGNYAYIDSLREGRKVLIDEMGSTLNTIAKDVKIQIEFNPVKVAAYRLIGYENRVLRDRDFNDDTIDAGEIGAGHTVTALYELIPAGDEPLKPEVDELEFQKPTKPTKAAKDGNIMLVKLRYKQPDGDTSDLLKLAVPDTSNRLNEPSLDLMFASQVASFGMLLRGSKYSGVATYDSVLEIAQSTLGENPESYRTEFIELVKLAKQYDRRGGRAPATGGF